MLLMYMYVWLYLHVTSLPNLFCVYTCNVLVHINIAELHVHVQHIFIYIGDISRRQESTRARIDDDTLYEPHTVSQYSSDNQEGPDNRLGAEQEENINVFKKRNFEDQDSESGSEDVIVQQVSAESYYSDASLSPLHVRYVSVTVCI